ncbi:MAG: co-chaperone GroES [Caldithrix sp.]|nr:co-chaperone GroES [Caldithrix sp.]
MNIKPLHDNVLIEPVSDEEKTAGGIIVPDTAKEKNMKGKVVAVGPGRVNKEGQRLPLDVKQNDIILHAKYSGTEIKIEDKEYLIIKEDDILAVLN